MKLIYVPMLLTLVSVVACSEKDKSSDVQTQAGASADINAEVLSSRQGTVGTQGPVGPVGPQGEQGIPGEGCVSAQVSGGVEITCGQTKILLPKAIDGKDGTSCVAKDATGGVNIVCGDLAPVFVRDGVDGKDGLNGTDGKDGLNGTDGKDGLNGTDGKDGLNGTDGKDGLNGTDGKDGLNGTDGKDGLNGTDGKDGLNGAAGKNGLDGSSCVGSLQDGGILISCDNNVKALIKYSRLLNGSFLSEKTQFTINENRFTKSFLTSNGRLAIHGQSTEANDSILFEPKAFECKPDGSTAESPSLKMTVSEFLDYVEVKRPILIEELSKQKEDAKNAGIALVEARAQLLQEKATLESNLRIAQAQLAQLVAKSAELAKAAYDAQVLIVADYKANEVVSAEQSVASAASIYLALEEERKDLTRQIQILHDQMGLKQGQINVSSEATVAKANRILFLENQLTSLGAEYSSASDKRRNEIGHAIEEISLELPTRREEYKDLQAATFALVTERDGLSIQANSLHTARAAKIVARDAAKSVLTQAEAALASVRTQLKAHEDEATRLASLTPAQYPGADAVNEKNQEIASLMSQIGTKSSDIQTKDNEIAANAKSQSDISAEITRITGHKVDDHKEVFMRFMVSEAELTLNGTKYARVAASSEGLISCLNMAKFVLSE